jgi:hypothetical protein
MKDISKRTKSENCSFTPVQITMKVNHLKKTHSEELVKIANDPSYKSPISRFPLLHNVFKSINTIKQEHVDLNTSVGKNANHSFFVNETDADDDESDELTQENNNIRHYREYSSRPIPNKAPENVQNNSFHREELCCQNSHSGITKRLNNTAHEDIFNRMILPAGENDNAYLDSFGHYLVSLLKKLPQNKAFPLQEQFIKKTLDEIVAINYEAEQRQEHEVNLINNPPSAAVSRSVQTIVKQTCKRGRPPHTDETPNSLNSNCKSNQTPHQKRPCSSQGRETVTITIEDNDPVTEIKEE